MKKILITACLVLLILATGTAARAQGTFYIEVPRDGGIYVFNSQDAYTTFLKTGELKAALTRLGQGPNGETLYFDSENALHLYNFKHNRPDEVVKQAAPAPEVQEKLPYRFSGLMFGDYYYNAQRDPDIGTLPNVATGGPEDQNGFQFRRIYLTFDDDLSKHFTTRFRLEADGTALSSDGKISVFVKDAYLAWKNYHGQNDMIFGIQPTSAYDVSESVWAFRSLEKTIMDLRGIVPSRDFSVSFRGRIDAAQKHSYWVTVGNNSGNKPEIDKYKRFYFQYQYKLTPRFTFTLYEDIKQAPQIVDSSSDNKGSNTAYNTAFFAGYSEKDRYAIGAETFYQVTKNGFKVGNVLDNKNTLGFSAFGWYQFKPYVGVVGRYDYFDPNSQNLSRGDARGLYLAALYVKPYKNVYIMPNVEVETYQKLPLGQTFKSSVTPRLTFYYQYP